MTQEQSLNKWNPRKNMKMNRKLNRNKVRDLAKKSKSFSQRIYSDILTKNRRIMHHSYDIVNNVPDTLLPPSPPIFPDERSIYLIRKQHQNQPDFFKSFNKRYAPDKELSQIFKKPMFKQTWSRSKTLEEIIAPHAFKLAPVHTNKKKLSFRDKLLREFPRSKLSNINKNILIFQNREFWIPKLKKWEGYSPCCVLEKLGVLLSNRKK